MADWKAYAKAARNTAKRQAPGARDAVRRTVDSGAREIRTYSRAASKVASMQGEHTRESARRSVNRARSTARASAKVAGHHYRRSRLGTRILRACRDASLMALSLGTIWFVFSRIIPIPITYVLIAAGVLVVLRFGWALFHNPFEEADDPAGAEEDLPPYDGYDDRADDDAYDDYGRYDRYDDRYRDRSDRHARLGSDERSYDPREDRYEVEFRERSDRYGRDDDERRDYDRYDRR